MRCLGCFSEAFLRAHYASLGSLSYWNSEVTFHLAERMAQERRQAEGSCAPKERCRKDISLLVPQRADRLRRQIRPHQVSDRAGWAS